MVAYRNSKLTRKEASQLKLIIHAEQLKREYQRLKQIFNPRSGCALSKVNVPSYDNQGQVTEWITKFEYEGLEMALLQHCHTRQYTRKASSISQFGG